MFGGIEAGGTKFVCGIGTGPEDLETDQFPTSSPDITVNDVLGAVRNALGVPVGFDTDLNAAILGEARWGAAQGLRATVTFHATLRK
ncbi:MAG: hypothetical protein JO033_21190 [Acidobacteriaceae bacterium]|nr:hypothetical protein [Acidobacteriaceae bacterium]MBV9502603.1 hypothetical protein [Acidobacteriaceae bacterium]